MSSLDKIIRDSQSNRMNITDQYCFPDIPVERLSNTGGKPMNNGFQHIDFKEGISTSSGLSKRVAGSGAFAGGTGDPANEVEKKAYVLGFEQGQKAGMETGIKQMEPVLDNFHQALLELEKVKREIHLNAEKETVELALAIAGKILCQEITTNRDVILNIVKEALKKVEDNEKIKIKISPSDLQLIRERDSRTSDFLEQMESVTIEGDETILNGGCVIETNSGQIDARIEKQLQAIEEAFKSELLLSNLGS